MTTSETNSITWPAYLLFSGDVALVSARQLYRAFNNPNDEYFSDWFNHRLEKHGLLPKRDFVLQKLEGRRIDYILPFRIAVFLAEKERGKRRDIYYKQLVMLRQQLKREGYSTDVTRLHEAVTGMSAHSPLRDLTRYVQPQAAPEGQKEIHPTEPENSPQPEPENSRPSKPETNPVPSSAEVILQMAQLLFQYEQQIRSLAKQVSQLSRNQQPKLRKAVDAGPPVEESPEKSMRNQIREHVNVYCQNKGQMQEQVYHQLYYRLGHVHGIRSNSYQRGASESYLDVAERIGVLDKVLSLLAKEFKITPEPQTSAANRIPPGGGPIPLRHGMPLQSTVISSPDQPY